MHYYKKNIGDYHKKAGRLSILQHGVYNLLIDSCYDREEFPTEAQAIDWVWASTNEEVDAVKFVLKMLFTLENEVYIQKRIREEVGKYHDNAATNRRIAVERETKRKDKSTNRAQAVNESPPNHKPLTINQEPVTKDTCQESKIPSCPHEKIIDLYHRVLPELQGVNKALWKGSKRQKDLADRWKQNEEFRSGEFWDWFFKNVRTSDHHMGGSERGWKADLGWLVKKENFIKLVERFSS